MSQGERGERGDQGVRGDIGLRGRDGVAGHIGADGATGAAGRDSLLSPAHVEAILASIKRLVRTVAFVLVVIVAYSTITSYSDRVDAARSSQAGCERTKLDRIANANAWTAQRDYIQGVTQAASVKEDVKSRARVAGRVFVVSSASLRSRARIDCKRAYRKPTIIPSVLVP